MLRYVRREGHEANLGEEGDPARILEKLLETEDQGCTVMRLLGHKR